ncbi:MAG TPA: sigma factor-like helix-turn-helix DNA-binding protein, partial [Terriglobales bacterium]
MAETAACLDISLEAVKTRLHRARSLLRKDLH